MRLLSWAPIWLVVVTLLNFPLANADNNEFIPKVTKTSSKSSFNIEPFDDSTTILKLEDSNLFRSENNGESWNPIKEIKDKVYWVHVDEFNSHDRAFAYSESDKTNIIYITEDQGKTWKSSKVPMDSKKTSIHGCHVLTHPTNKNYLIARCTACDASASSKTLKGKYTSNTRCETITFLSQNLGKSYNKVEPPSIKKIESTISTETICRFMRNTKNSQLGDSDATVVCSYDIIEQPKNSPIIKTTSSFFTTIDGGKTIKQYDIFKDKAISSYAIKKSNIVVLTQEDKYNRHSAKKLWVSKDGISFKEAYLPTQLRYTVAGMIKEDDFGKIILPIRRQQSATTDDDTSTVAEMLVSDSTGLKFTPFDWVPQDTQGWANLYMPKELKGTMIGTFASMMRRFGRKHKGSSNSTDERGVTKITVDNGKTWSNLKVVDPANKDSYPCNIDDVEHCSLQILSPFQTDAEPSPGILIRIGYVSDGNSLEILDNKTFISTDGGLTWRMIFDYPVIYAIGDSANIIVAVPFDPNEDNDPESEFYYSLDQGETWNEYQLEEPIIPLEIVSTTPDGSGLNFIINGFLVTANPFDENGTGNFIYAIDFSELYDKKLCTKDDFEQWYLGNGNCINGAKYSYPRRKQNSKCIARKLFEDLELTEQVCDECTNADYECSFEFIKDNEGKCVPDYNLLTMSGACSATKKDTLKIAPMQLITGDKCKKPLDISPVDVSCEDVPNRGGSPNKGKGELIRVTENTFGSRVTFYQYFDTYSDESLIIGDAHHNYFISHDSGQTVTKIESMDQKIIEVVFNTYFNSSAYLFGDGGNLFVTNDGGHTITSTKLPEGVQLGFPLDFHSKDPNTFIYYGGKNCDSILSKECHAVAYITRDGGKTFTELLDNTIHCEFAGSQYEHPSDENLIICQVKEKGFTKRSLVSSTDYFKNNKEIIFDDILGYMSSGKFSIVAVTHGENELRAYVTLDGKEFAEAKLPKDLEKFEQEAFTVLNGDPSSILLHFSTNHAFDKGFGRLLKSNSNGTSFVTLEPGVNRVNSGLVDFEKIQGLEGVMVINVVDNMDDVRTKNADKKLKTKITFNDGSDWTFLKPPARDSEGKKYNCKSNSLSSCSLNLHGYTDRTDIRDTYSSGSAIGYMFAVGNVGESLLPYDECSTFLTIDGGATWKEVRKGPYQWEYGDHGGILVLVPDKKASDTISFSIDSGKTWVDYKFTDAKVTISDIVTVPQDSAMRFLLIGASPSVKGSSAKTFTIDFTGIFPRQCIFDFNNQDSDDFSYFKVNPSRAECLFGHQKEYLKKIHNNCFIGNVPLADYSRITKNCSCIRADFECDYNFYKAKDGTCKLVEGLDPIDPSDVCKINQDLIEFSEPTGYRKIPLSTCQGGLRLDASSDLYPCPGKEKQFNQKYGVGALHFILIFGIPFLTFVGIAWFIYINGIRRNGGFSRFGEIRLGDDELIENNNTDKVVNYILKGGMFVFSGLFSRFQKVKHSFNEILTRFRERSGRGGPSYSSLLHDQFLDEADDLLAGHDEDANDLSSFADHDSNFDIDDEGSFTPGLEPEHAPYADEPASTTNTGDAQSPGPVVPSSNDEESL
ncbi:type I sorting receptor NDAI_0B02910 [Naumovozyma dairenensis CBS 421]|uniref:VPS10 domain-containing protein n=1 Tax=Naumovozyma dairenensis (strain ATCC 10597 / BCRC 20456 / CBS 421 / NBRC 0211 / NRRL Y-12639) TaxID=1071378 RepID=G0W6B5_NAUDC|nr:hypothetical protein NDAI_0B02910 [Naumovozyma dairenensis CBS 421]CCD23326.1 hypothetical protein NDAI_0B02910 [Naumovozyma dairenensis CBS 421]